jgi:DNA-binding transcriptional LysR family regulator
MPRIVQEAPQWLTVLRLVGAGLGVTIAPASVAQISDPTVVFRRIPPRAGRTNIDLAFLTEALTPAVERFRAVVRTVYRGATSFDKTASVR